MKDLFNNLPYGRPNPLDDYFFFRVMGQKGDETQLLGFLNTVLGRTGKKQIESLKILENTAFRKEYEEGKSCILDVLAVLQDGTRVNIEVQLSDEKNMGSRSLYYCSKVYLGCLEEGQDYKEIPNVIAVNIVGFDFPPTGKLHTCFRLREDSDLSLILPALEIHFISMAKWGKLKGKDIKNDPLHRWLAWLDKNSPPELVKEVVSMEPAILTADERFVYVTQDRETYERHWRRQMAEMDERSRLNSAREEGIEQGMAQGIEQGTLEVARNALAKGLSPEMVHEITGLSSEVIENL